MEEEKCPLQYHEFKILDHNKMCPSYAAILRKTPEQGIAVEELSMLQSDLETLLAAVNRRSRLLESENKVLVDWLDRKDKKGSRQKELEILNSLKRCKPSFADDRGIKKQKYDDKPFAQKVKGNKKSFGARMDYFDTEEDTSTIKSKTTDAPNRFWAMVEPYCADITMDDLKFLEDSIKASEDIDEYYKVPPLGKHYSEKWALEDLTEEQESGKKVRDDKKQSTLKCSNREVVDGNSVKDILKKSSDDSNLTADEACPFGPLTQRLISAFVEENIIAPVTEDVMDAGKLSLESIVKVGTTGGKLLHVPHARNLELCLKQELIDQGIIEKSEEDNCTNEDSGDEVLFELKKRQAELQAVVNLNQQMKRDLLEAAQTEIRKQELRHRVQSADSEVLEWFRKFSAYKQMKKSPSKKEREMASNSLKERETFVRVLNSEEL